MIIFLVTIIIFLSIALIIQILANREMQRKVRQSMQQLVNEKEKTRIAKAGRKWTHLIRE